MKTSSTKVLLRGALFAAAIAACDSGAPTEPKSDGQGTTDIQEALAALPEATVLMYTPDGVPTYIVGDLAKLGETQTDQLYTAEQQLRTAITPVLRVFRLTNDDLKLRKVNTDENGHRHFRFAQTRGGLEVVGSEIVVHVDVKGGVYSVNGTARGDISAQLGLAPVVTQDAANSRVTGDTRFRGLAVSATRAVYVQTEDGAMHKAYETTVTGTRGKDPARDKVFVDQDTGEIIAVHPQIHFAENRKVYSLSNGTSLPGTLKRSEGQAATTDVDVNAAYDGTGAAYEAYKNFFNRDSYNNAGAVLTSSVHYSTNYCNAYWDGTQMVYGDGSASQNCAPLARSVDVTAHELTHAVTENESGLIYSGESGGINESYSDVFGAFVEAWVDGGKTGTNLVVSADTFLVGEDILPPALRFMCNPIADGASKDLWTTGAGSVDVHYSSGISNLAFCLMVKGGTHPRGKTTVNVPALGATQAAALDTAIRVYYKAQVDILTPSSNYAALRTAQVQAAQQLGMSTATQDAVGCAWAAVGVGTAPTSCGGTPPPPPPGDTVLSNGVALAGQSGALGADKFYKLTVAAGQTSLVFTTAGGTGDSDLYVQAGSHPTTTTNICKSEGGTTAETCTIANPAAGDYFVLIHAYSAFSGMTITGTASGGGGGGDVVLTSGVALTGQSGALNANKFYKITATAGKKLTVNITGGTGDCDLYTKKGAHPTTAVYDCRPFISGNNETCTVTSTTAGDYFIMLRGFSAYTGVTLKATLQ